MTNEKLTAQVSERICSHMNQDHKKALFKYASFYGGISKPSKVKMIELTNTAIKLEVDGQTIIIKFDHILADSKDAHQTLVSMLKAIENKN